ncbi:MAG: helix-turn-helix domain-containing protein [Gemmataceae bacterium]
MNAAKPVSIERPSAKDAALARESIQRLQAQIQKSGQEFQIVVNGQSRDAVSLPHSAVQILIAGLTEIGRGNGINLIPQRTELSTQEAAEILNLSRPYVVRLLDEGKIPSHKVGTHRRVRIEDVLMYQKQSDAERLNALRNLIDEAQELDMGY